MKIAYHVTEINKQWNAIKKNHNTKNKDEFKQK